MERDSLLSLSQLCSLRLAQIIKNGEEWPYETFIPAQIGDEVFKALNEICVMQEEILRRFAETTLDITKFYAYGMVSSPALSVLKKYDHLVSLRFVEESDEYSDDPYYPQSPNYVFIRRLVENNLSKEAATSIRQLEIIGFNTISLYGLHLLPNLESLSIREFSNEDQDVEVLADIKLRSLDVSEITVYDFSWLLQSVNLEILILHDVDITDVECLDQMTSFPKLRYLDVSNSDEDDTISLFVFNTLLTSELSPWPELRCLDLGGSNFSGYTVEEAAEGIRQMVKKNPQIRMIGLVKSSLNYYEFDLEEVQIFNCCSNKSIIQSIDYYTNNAFRKYILDVLYVELTNQDFLETEDLCQMVELVCLGLKKYPYHWYTVFDCLRPLQYLSSAIIDRVPPRLRQRCVNCCLMLEENDESVWNSLVYLGAHSLDHVNHFQLLHLALSTANNWKFVDSFANLLGVISFVTKKNGKVQGGDIVSSSLRTLWNQTEDVAMNDCIEHLQKTLGTVDIEKKPLVGVSNGYSVAELESYKPEIQKLLRAIYACLAGNLHDCEEGTHYFAFQRGYAYTGILSVLLTYGQLDEKTSTVIDSHLQNLFSTWQMPSKATSVAPFRSFTVFERIMERTKFDGVRLWCVWGLLNVIMKDSPIERHFNYPDILKKSPLLQTFKTLYMSEPKNQHIGTLLKSEDGLRFQNMIRLIDSHPTGFSTVHGEPVEDSYIIYLVDVLKDKNARVSTLEIVLTSLWSFADGCPRVSGVICSAEGFEVLRDLLKKYARDTIMERRILAVLSCLCEVEELANPIVKDQEFINMLRACLDRKVFIEHDNPSQIERCYFLTGILSNFLTYGLGDKTLEEEIDAHIKKLITERGLPSVSTAVGVFQTFKVLERIMDRTRHDGPRLWCLWSLLVVIQNKSVTLIRNYPEMLKKSSIFEKLPGIQDQYDQKSRMHKMAKEILGLVAK